ncbi:MAG: sodium-dependent transporter [Alphaproteobacteria bacterium]|nr:MAG: sodium-dependent transporter [Alphaproteobacteria bacterium]
MSDTSGNAYPSFSSRLAFILTTAGAAVGLGNVWGFPYVAGKNGGGGFLLLYLVALALVAAPAFMAELLLGRMGKASPPTALRRLQAQAGSRVPWAPVAWMGLVATILILSFYDVIAGQALFYGWTALTGGFAGWDAGAVTALDTGFKASPAMAAFWSALFTAATIGIVSFDIRSGLERAGKIMMPALFLMLIGLMVFALVEGDAAAAFAFLFGFHDMRLDTGVVLEAVGQAFFTLSVGVGGIMTYGSYMGADVRLPRATLWIVAMDLAVALMAGLVIFPLVFAHNLDAAAGPGLIFITLPLIFTNIPAGAFVAFVFFLLLTFAAITSSISLMAPTVARLQEAGWSRARAAATMGLIAFLCGFATIWSFSDWQDFYPLAFLGLDGMTAFDLIREGVSNFVLPLSGIAYALMIGWWLKRDDVRKALPAPDGALFAIWYRVLGFLVPLAIGILFLTALVG